MRKTFKQGPTTYNQLVALKKTHDITHLSIGLMPGRVLSVVRVEYRKKQT